MAVIHKWGRHALALELIFPGVKIYNLDRSPPWDHDAVQDWFLRSVTRSPKQLRVVERKRGLSGTDRNVTGQALGWEFARGSTAVNEDGSRHRTVSVLQDGRRVLDGFVVANEASGFNFSALRQMSDMSRVHELPPGPLSWREENEDALVRQATPHAHAALKEIFESRGLRVEKFER
jgi:hypothetical protein